MDYFISAVIGISGYIGAHFVGKPILALRETRETISKTLVLFANLDTIPTSIGSLTLSRDYRILEAKQTYHHLASTLVAQANSIPLYGLWSLLRIVPKFEEIETVSRNLIGLSDTVGDLRSLDNSTRRQKIEQALRLRT